MEIPSSIAVTTRDVIVPEFTSVAVNDGMGVVITDLDERDIDRERIEGFFRRVNAHAAANFFDRNRYSISIPELRRALLEGAGGVLERYQLDPTTLARLEWSGRVPTPAGGAARIEDVVPSQLLPTPFSRCEMGLNFGGNHFLEMQVVDEILDPHVARRFGLRKGQIVVMYHLGPGPFSGTLLHHYSRRTKLRRERVPLFFFSKLLFHFLQRARRGRMTRKWGLHFKANGTTPYPLESEEGLAIRSAMAMAINYGFAYRMATVRAIFDGLHEAVSPNVHAELLCDIAHNGVYEERYNGGSAWVARHNACGLAPDRPTIVAGSYDIPSYLGIGTGNGDPRLHSYDHGAGHLIDEYREAGRLETGPGAVLRMRMTRGRDGRMVKCEAVALHKSEPIDRLMECLERNHIMQTVARLRPIGNLKN